MKFKLPPRAPEAAEPVVASKGERRMTITRSTGKSHTSQDHKDLKPANEITLLEAHGAGRRAMTQSLNGKDWGIVNTSVLSPGNGQPSRVRVNVLVGEIFSFEVDEETSGGYAAAIDRALLGLAGQFALKSAKPALNGAMRAEKK